MYVPMLDGTYMLTIYILTLHWIRLCKGKITFLGHAVYVYKGFDTSIHFDRLLYIMNTPHTSYMPKFSKKSPILPHFAMFCHVSVPIGSIKDDFPGVIVLVYSPVDELEG